MAITLKSMALNTQITAISATARQVVYTALNGVAQLDQITVSNANASTAYDVYVYMKGDDTTSGTLIEIQKKNIGALSSATFDLCIAHKIPLNGTIQVHSGSATDTYITLSGIERQQ